MVIEFFQFPSEFRLLALLLVLLFLKFLILPLVFRLLSFEFCPLVLQGLPFVLLLLVFACQLLQPLVFGIEFVGPQLQRGFSLRQLLGLLFALCPLLVAFRLTAFQFGGLIREFFLSFPELLFAMLLLFGLPLQFRFLLYQRLFVLLERGSLMLQIFLQGLELGVTLCQLILLFVQQFFEFTLEFRSLTFLLLLLNLKFLNLLLPFRLSSLEFCALVLQDPPLVLLLLLVFDCQLLQPLVFGFELIGADH